MQRQPQFKQTPHASVQQENKSIRYLHTQILWIEISESWLLLKYEMCYCSTRKQENMTASLQQENMTASVQQENKRIEGYHIKKGSVQVWDVPFANIKTAIKERYK